ncbi:MAG: dephospho-CoA kinase [Pseudomonadota bacterium]
MITVGLTGSIGMGKSTTAKMFAEAGAAVWDADDAVHRLYASGGAGADAIADLAPGAVRDGAVDRAILREMAMADPELLKRVEAAIHPLVAKDRAAFLTKARADGARVAVLDIPLIFETGAAGAFDRIVVASAPAEVQRARVLARPGMTEAAFETILAKQVPDAEKRAGADYVVDTGEGMEPARAAVARIMEELRAADA